MAAEVIDISSLQDEDLLRRMWQQTEDLPRKKEIRARMYKLREQRLKEFYTTGEVLLDVEKATPRNNNIAESHSFETVNVEKSLIPVINSTETIMAHTDSMEDRGFMRMKSQEIFDSDSSLSNRQNFQGDGGSDRQCYWKVESSSESYQAVGRDGKYEVKSQSQAHNLAGENGRIVVDSGFATENESIIDRNGDIKVLSSRSYDTSGRDMRNQRMIRGDMEPFPNSRESELSREMNLYYNDFDGDGENLRYKRDERGSNVISGSVSESKTSESRVTSSSQVSRKWTTDIKTSSSTVTSSKSTSEERDGFFRDSTGRELQSFDSEIQPHGRGVTEVKKTIIRGGKVIEETIRYIDGKPVDEFTRTSTQTSPPETVTVIRGGKLIKEKVSSKTTDSRCITTENQRSSTTNEAKESFRSFSSDKMDIDDQEEKDLEKRTRMRNREPDSGNADPAQTSNKRPQHSGEHQGSPQTKTVIRGGKVIKEKVSSNIEDTANFILQESSNEKISSTTRIREGINQTSESINRRSVAEDDSREYYLADDDQHYPDEHTKSDKQPRTNRQSTPARDYRPSEQFLEDDNAYDRKTAVDSRMTATKTSTVIRSGKTVSQKIEKVDEESVSGFKKSFQDIDNDDVVDHRKAPQIYDLDQNDSGEPQYQEESKKNKKNISENEKSVVKTTKTIIRGGKLIKEVVHDEDDNFKNIDDKGKNILDEDKQKPEKFLPTSDRPEKRNLKATPNKLNDDTLEDEDELQHPNKKKPSGKHPRDKEQDNTDEDRVENRVVKGKKTDIQEVTSRTNQKHTTEIKTVIRGGKLVKERVTVIDDEDTFKSDRGKTQQKPSSPTSKAPQKNRPATDDAPKDGKKSKGISPEPGTDYSPKRKLEKPAAKYSDSEVPSDIEGSEYPSGSEAPFEEEEMPYNVITVLRSGKLVKEIVPISDDYTTHPDGSQRKLKPSKDLSKDHPKRPEDKSSRPSNNQSSRSPTLPDKKHSPDNINTSKNRKKPKDDGSNQLKIDASRPDSKKKELREEQPRNMPKEPHSFISDDEHPDDGTRLYSDSKEPKKPIRDKPTSKGRISPSYDDQDHYEPRQKTPGKDGTESQKGRSPDKHKPSKVIENDTDEKLVKTITVIRGGKVVSETVKLTDEEIRERKLLETRSKINEQTNRENLDFIESEKPRPKAKSEPRDSQNDDDDNDDDDRSNRGQSSIPRDKSKNPKAKDITEREKPKTLKTVTVIRSGKVVKETVKDDESRLYEDSTPRNKATKVPEGHNLDDRDESSPDEKPRNKTGDDNLVKPYNSQKLPQDRKPSDHPAYSKGDKLPEVDKNLGRGLPDDRPNEFITDKPEKLSPNKIGRRPEEYLKEDKPQDASKNSGDRVDKRSPGKTGQKPVDDQLSGKKPQNETNRRSPGHPDNEYPTFQAIKTRDDEADWPDNERKRPEYDFDERVPSESDHHPERIKPTDGIGRKEPYRQSPDKTDKLPDDRYSPNNYKKPRDSQFGQFHDYVDGDEPDEYDVSSPKSRLSPEKLKRKPEDIQKQPSNDLPRHDNTTEPRGYRPDAIKKPLESEPDDQKPKKSDYLKEKEFIERERTAGMKTVTVIRAGKIIKELVPADDDEPHSKKKAEPHTKPGEKDKKPKSGDKEPSEGKRTVDDKRRPNVSPDDINRNLKDDYDKTPKASQPNKPEKRTSNNQPKSGKPQDSFPSHSSQGKKPEKGELEDDRYDRFSPNERRERPKSNEFGDFENSPKDQNTDFYKKPDTRLSEKPGKKPNENNVDRRKPDEFEEPDRKPTSKRPSDDRPQGLDRRPKDEPDRDLLNKAKDFLGDQYPDHEIEKPYSRDTSDRRHFDKDGRQPMKKPDATFYETTGRHPQDDHPENVKPEDQRPKKDQKDKSGRRVEPDHPDSFYKKPYDEKPRGEYPDSLAPDQKKPDGYKRIPQDDRPDQYSPQKHTIQSDQKPRKQFDEVDRHPSNSKYPEDTTRKFTEVKPGFVSPKDESPDLYKSVQRKDSDDLPDRVPDGKHPMYDHLKRKPLDSSPDQFMPDNYKRHPDKDEPEKLRSHPGGRYDDEADRPRKYYPGESRKPEDYRNFKHTHPDDISPYESEDYSQWTQKSDKISVDVSASHAQFASSLRAPPLERPETPTKPSFGDQSPKSNSFIKNMTPKQTTGMPLKDPMQKPRTKYPQQPSSTKDTPQKSKSPYREEPQYNTKGKPQNRDSFDRSHHKSTEINAVINRLTSDTQSSRERRKQTSSRNLKSNVTKRTHTPRVSPNTSPTRGKPKSDKTCKRTTSTSSTVSTEDGSDFHYQKPDRLDSEEHDITEVNDFIQTEKVHSRKVQRIQTESVEDDDYRISPSRIRDRSPSDKDSYGSWPRRSRSDKPNEDDLNDREYPEYKRPDGGLIRPKKPEEKAPGKIYDMPDRQKPINKFEDRYPLKGVTSIPSNRNITDKTKFPSEKYSPREPGSSTRSPGMSPVTSPGKRRQPDQSPQRNNYIRRPMEESPDRKTKKPEGLDKPTSLKKGITTRPNKEITEYPSQKRSPIKDKLPQTDKITPKKPNFPAMQPGSRQKPATSVPKKPDYLNSKPDSTRPLHKPQNGFPDVKSPVSKKNPKGSSFPQPEKSKPGKPGIPSHVIPSNRKLGGQTPSDYKTPKARRLSEDDDLRKLNDFAAITRRQSSTITTTTVKTENFINSESGRRPSTRKNILDFDWNGDVSPKNFLIDENSSVSSQECITPTTKSKKPASTDLKPRKTGETYPSLNGTKQKPKPSSKSQKDIPKNKSDKPKKSPDQSLKANKQPKNTESETSDNQSDVEIFDVELIAREKKPKKFTEDRYRDQIDLIHREQETLYGTKVISSVRDNVDEVFTGKVEMPDSSRESTRSPEYNRQKYLPVDERSTEELRPRYADQVSEPEEETDQKRKPNKEPQKALHGEEPKKSLRDMLVKSTLEKIDKIPDLCDIGDYTDETVNMSVAERVNKFMETALRPDGAQLSRPEDITLKGLDDTINKFIETSEMGSKVLDKEHQKKESNSVIKAKTMFETIANQTTITSTSKKDFQKQEDFITNERNTKPDDRFQDHDRFKQPEDYPSEGYESPTKRPSNVYSYSDKHYDGSQGKHDKPFLDSSPERYGNDYRSDNNFPNVKTGSQPGDRFADHYDGLKKKPKDEPNSRSPEHYYNPTGTPRKIPGEHSPEHYNTSRRKPEDRPSEHSPERYNTSRRKPEDRPSEHSPERYNTSRRKPEDRPSEHSPERYNTSRRKPEDRPSEHSPERYNTSRRKPEDRPSEHSPERYNTSRRKPEDRPSEHSPERYNTSRRKPEDRPSEHSPEHYNTSRRKPEDRPSEHSPERYNTSRRKPEDRPSEHSPERYNTSRRKPEDRPSEHSPERYNTSRRKPEDRPSEHSPERYNTSRRKPEDRPSEHSPERYNTSRRKPEDRPSEHSPERYNTSRRKPEDRPSEHSPERYNTSRRKPEDRPSEHSPERYNTSRRKPEDRPSEHSPERYNTSKRKPENRPSDISPERYNNPKKKPGDRQNDRSPVGSMRNPNDHPRSLSPKRYDNLSRKPGDRSSDYSSPRYSGSKKSPNEKSSSRSPERYFSPTRKTGNEVPDRDSERYEGPKKRSGDRPIDRSSDRDDGFKIKQGNRPSDRSKPNDRSHDHYDKITKRPGEKDLSKKAPKEKTPVLKHSDSPERYNTISKDRPKHRGSTPDDYSPVLGLVSKKPQQNFSHRSEGAQYTFSESVSQSVHTSNRNISPRARSQSPNSYDTYSTLPSHRQSPTRTTLGRTRSSDIFDFSYLDDEDRSPTTSKYLNDRFLYDKHPSTFKSITSITSESVSTKKSPSKELADQVRRLSSPKTDSSKYPRMKSELTKPLDAFDKYTRLDNDKKTTTSIETTKYSRSQISSSYPSRTTPEKRSTKPLFGTEPKNYEFLLPEDRSSSPLIEKTKKIPENSSLKAPALLKKQHSHPENLRYSTSVYQQIRDYKDDDDIDTDSTTTTNRKTLLSEKPYVANDSKFQKFGVMLKKTTSGNNFIRKGPVDVGKKETELDRTYDLDLLNGMLERAKGYEERRLIRGQIRTVKTMLENNELTRIGDRKKPQADDYGLSYKPTTKSPLKSSPLDTINGYDSERYKTYKTTEKTTMESHSLRTSKPDKNYSLRSTATLTLSPKSDSSFRRSPEKLSSTFPDRRSPEKTYPRSKYSGEPVRPGEKIYASDREPVGMLVDSETRKLLKRPDSPKKGSPFRTFQEENLHSVSKTIRQSHTEHETKETNLTDSIISSYGVGPTDDKGRPLFGLQALRRQKGKSDVEPTDFHPKEIESPLDIKDSSGRAFFGLNALRAPKKNLDQQVESPISKDYATKYESHSTDSLLHRSLRDISLTDDSESFIRNESRDDDLDRLMGEPGQSLKDMIRKHERLMEEDGSRRRPNKTTTSSSYSTSTVIRSSAVSRPDGTVSVRKNVIRGETTAKDDEEPQTRVTTEEYSYETPRDRFDDSIEADDVYGRKSIKGITSRSSTSDSLHNKYRSNLTSSLNTTRKSLSPDRKSPELHFVSPLNRLNRTYVDDYYPRRRDESDSKNPASRISIADRLTQLSKKFSNDFLDKNVSDMRNLTMDNHYSNYTSKTSSTYRTPVDGKSSPLTDIYKPLSESSTHDRKYPSSNRDDDSALLGFRRGSSTPIEDVKESLYRKFSGSEEIEHTTPSFARVGKGGSVKALSQKFQQAAAEAESPKTGASSYPKAGLILRSTSFKQTNGELSTPDSPGLKQSTSMEVRVGSPGRSGSIPSDYRSDRSMQDMGRGWSPGREDHIEKSDDYSSRRVVSQKKTETRLESSGTRSFLGNSSKVTGVQDIISRMRAADEETGSEDSPNDSEARALFNKFLGASVMMSGMEPLVKSSGGSVSTQIDRQRILNSLPSDGYREIVTTTTETRRSWDNFDDVWDEKKLRQLLDECTDYEGRRKLRARLRTIMADKSASDDSTVAAQEDQDVKSGVTSGDKNLHRQDSDFTSRTGSPGSTSRVTSKTTYNADISDSTSSTNKPISPFAKFQQLDRQNSNSVPSSPSASKAPLFVFTDSKLSRSASGAKDRLLQWCQIKTKDYKNIQIENFSTSWSNGLAFCALIHHFRPEAFDYDSLSPKERRKNFELAFKVAEEQANIAPLLDVEDMVMMKKPDWKCVFTYVQSIYHRFKNEEI